MLSFHLHAEFCLSLIPSAGQPIYPAAAGRMREEGGDLLPSAHRRSGLISGTEGVCSNGNQTGHDEESGNHRYRFHFERPFFFGLGQGHLDYETL